VVATLFISRPLGQQIIDDDIINNLLALDISSGFIWAKLSDQVSGWIRRINDQNITKWILYLSALEEKEDICLERIQQELETIREVLIRLSRDDLLEYFTFGNWFRKMNNPILVEFLQNEFLLKYEHFKRQFDEYKGYIAEIFMGQVLLSSYQVKAYPGHFFNSEQDIPIRNSVIFVNYRVRLNAGDGNEIDILASIGGHMWVCQSK